MNNGQITLIAFIFILLTLKILSLSAELTGKELRINDLERQLNGCQYKNEAFNKLYEKNN